MSEAHWGLAEGQDTPFAGEEQGAMYLLLLLLLGV